jgi:RNA polymerase sigma-70 factor (ECF subfamily)
MTIPPTDCSLLIVLMQEGDRREEAWKKFEARYRDIILNWCRRRELPQDCAQDLTQEVLLKLFRELPRGAYKASLGPFRSWLKAVVNNVVTDHWRRWQRQFERGGVGGTSFVEQLANLKSPEAAADELSGTIERHEQNIAAEVVERVRARIKETTWEAFFRHGVEERPAEEVAAQLSLSVQTVYKATYRVRQMLLKEYCHAHPNGNDPAALPGRGHPPEVAE